MPGSPPMRSVALLQVPIQTIPIASDDHAHCREVLDNPSSTKCTCRTLRCHAADALTGVGVLPVSPVMGVAATGGTGAAPSASCLPRCCSWSREREPMRALFRDEPEAHPLKAQVCSASRHCRIPPARAQATYTLMEARRRGSRLILAIEACFPSPQAVKQRPLAALWWKPFTLG